MLLVLLIGMLIATACNLPRPGGRATRTPTPNLVTVAAQTVQAQLTEQASVGGGTIAVPTFTVVATTPVPTWTQRPPTSQPPPPTKIFVPCDWAMFISDVTIPDGTRLSPNQAFTKTWRLRNVGTCTWTNAYQLVFDQGAAMSGPSSVNLAGNVAPGQTIDVSVNLVAPAGPGRHKGYWKLRNSAGASFGIGGNANTAFWVDIEVVSTTITVTPTVTPTTTVTPTGTATGTVVIYDMALNYCAAQWVSGAGNLPCPGTTADNAGFVLRADNPTLSNGTTYTGAALETHPQWVDSGVITGKYPAVSVQNGYRFRSTIGCLSGGTACDVTFQLNYRSDGGSLQTMGEWTMTYADAPKELNMDVSSLAGHSVEFVLAVLSHGAPNQDWAVWHTPRIVR